MYKRFISYVVAALLGAASAAAVFSVFTVTTVDGSGMEPAVKSGSMALINRLAYRMDGAGPPEVGSVIAFKSDVHGEDGEGSVLVRRVAANAGDVVEIKDDIFYRNGKPYQEYMAVAAHMEEMSPVKLGENEIFVLCDDRRSSMDSRNEAIGILDCRHCIGKVCFE